MHLSTRRTAVTLMLIGGSLAACANPTGLPPGPGTSLPATSAPGETALPASTATPAPHELVVCQKGEPASLYFYGDDTSPRAGVMEALFDGPIDSVGFAYQPVILESLPSLENGGAVVNEVTVNPGDPVVDAARNEVTELKDGVTLAQLDGSRAVYSGTVPARTLQISARFTLKPGVTWSDGQPVSADDSVYSFELAASPGTPRSKYLVDRTARYAAVDDRTVQWTGLPGWNDSEFFLRFWSPMPRHHFGNFSAAEMQTQAEANQDPLAWGPFQVAEWVAGDHLTLIRNPYYFRASEGLPRLDTVKFRFDLDAGQIITEMLAGRCDIGSTEADFSGALQLLLEAQSGGTLAPQFALSTTFEHLDFNIQPAPGYSRGAGRTLFEDARIRHAFAYCLDREALVSQLFNGLSAVPAAYLPATHPLYAADRVVLYPFDPAQGQQLLAEAGWIDSNNDGVRDNGGHKLALDYISGPPGDAFRETLMQWVTAQLHDNCGVELIPAQDAPEALYDPWPSGLFFGRQFDVGEFPWRTGIQPPCDLYLTESIPGDANPGGSNDTGYSNPAFDEACRAAQNALDEATRREKHAEAQAIFTQDLPSLPLFWRVMAGVATPQVSGYRVDTTARSDLWNLEEIDINR